MTIGDRIRIRREKLNMSQDELAKKLGYKSRSSINKIELGLYNLKQSKIKAIADALDTTPSYIMGWNEGWEEKYNPDGKLEKEVNLIELIEQQHGKSIMEAFTMYTQLDSDDQGEIRGEMKQMLKAEKYSMKKESKNA